MKILLDGYNVIARLPSLRRHFPSDLKRAREELNDMMRRFKRARGHSITVVYDGPGGVWGRQESQKAAGIREVFTSARDQADDVIMRMARENPSGLLVVTADNRVASNCRKAGAAVMTPEELDDKVFEATIMAEKGMETDDIVEAKPGKKKGPSKRLPRKKRREQRMKKKL